MSGPILQTASVKRSGGARRFLLSNRTAKYFIFSSDERLNPFERFVTLSSKKNKKKDLIFNFRIQLLLCAVFPPVFCADALPSLLCTPVWSVSNLHLHFFFLSPFSILLLTFL